MLLNPRIAWHLPGSLGKSCRTEYLVHHQTSADGKKRETDPKGNKSHDVNALQPSMLNIQPCDVNACRQVC